VIWEVPEGGSLARKCVVTAITGLDGYWQWMAISSDRSFIYIRKIGFIENISI
jgi:hypothetical protein